MLPLNLEQDLLGAIRLTIVGPLEFVPQETPQAPAQDGMVVSNKDLDHSLTLRRSAMGLGWTRTQ